MLTTDQLRSSRELFYNLTLRELRGKYKRSVLGWLWSLLNPLAIMGIYSLVFAVFLEVPVPIGDPSGLEIFALYLLCGLLPYNFLANSLTGGMSALVGNANLVKKVWFPRELLVASNTSAAGVGLAIEMGLLAVALLVAGNMVLPWIVPVLGLMVLQTIFVLGLALGTWVASALYGAIVALAIGAATMRAATSFWNISVRLSQAGGQSGGVSQFNRSCVPTL